MCGLDKIALGERAILRLLCHLCREVNGVGCFYDPPKLTQDDRQIPRIPAAPLLWPIGQRRDQIGQVELG